MRGRFIKMYIRTYGNDILCNAVQDRLFGLGYEWLSGGTQLKKLDDHSYLATSKHGTIQYGADPKNVEEYYEHNLSDLYLLTPSNISPKVGGVYRTRGGRTAVVEQALNGEVFMAVVGSDHVDDRAIRVGLLGMDTWGSEDEIVQELYAPEERSDG